MTNSRSKRYTPEIRQRSVRMVLDNEANYASRNQAISAIAPKIGCNPDTLRSWVKQSEIDHGTRDGMSSEEQSRIKSLERENKELRQANEILKKASAYFAQAELDRPFKR